MIRIGGIRKEEKKMWGKSELVFGSLDLVSWIEMVLLQRYLLSISDG